MFTKFLNENLVTKQFEATGWQHLTCLFLQMIIHRIFVVQNLLLRLLHTQVVGVTIL